jgi:two-component system, NarL family, response regulator DevR
MDQGSAQGATHIAAAQNRGRRPPAAKGRIRILIVDDHEVVRHGLRQVLEREPDMEIIGEAGTGLDAVRMAASERPDVVLLDAKLGDVDGAAVCRRVLAVSPATAVVVLTAYLRMA